MSNFYNPKPIYESALLNDPIVEGGCYFIDFPRFEGKIDNDHIANAAYRGAGVGLMIVSKDSDGLPEAVQDFNYVSLDKNNRVNIKRKAVKTMLEEAYKRGDFIFLGTCSCYTFCEPTILDAPEAALSVKMFGKLNPQSIATLQKRIDIACQALGFTLFQ